MPELNPKFIENAKTLAKKTRTDEQGHIDYDGDFFKEALEMVDPDIKSTDVERSVKALSGICELACELTGIVGQEELKKSKSLDRVMFKTKLGNKSKIAVAMLRKRERNKTPTDKTLVTEKGVLMPKFELINKGSANLSRIKKRHIELAKDL